MAWRVERWGKPDLGLRSQYVYRGKVGRKSSLRRLPDPLEIWKKAFAPNNPKAQARIRRVQEELHSQARLDKEDSWVCIRPIGAGGFGVVTLWERQDEQGNKMDVRRIILPAGLY